MPGSKNTNQPSSEIMTTDEAARFLKVGVGAVRRWAREGMLKGYRMGGRGEWRYLKEDVVKFLMGGNLSLGLVSLPTTPGLEQVHPPALALQGSVELVHRRTQLGVFPPRS